MRPSAKLVAALLVAAALMAAWGIFRKPPSAPAEAPIGQAVTLRRPVTDPAADPFAPAIALLGEIEPAGPADRDPWQVVPLPATHQGADHPTQSDNGWASADVPPALPATYPSTGLPEFRAPPQPKFDPQHDVFEPPVAGPRPSLAPRGTPPRTHKVRDGDTLVSLAQKYLGSGQRFRELYEANRDRLASPDLLPIGTVLRIPEAPGAVDQGRSSEQGPRYFAPAEEFLTPIPRDQMPDPRTVYPTPYD